MKKIIVLAIILLSTGYFCFASGKGENAGNPQDGRVSVVSLSPGITETFFALGCGDCLVGRTDYCTDPPECLSLPSVGTLYDPDLELIVSLNPDYVLSTSIVDTSVIMALNRAGIKALQFECEESLDGTFRLIEEIGEIAGVSSRSNELVSSMKKQIADVKTYVASEERVSCVYLIGWSSSSVYAATGKTYLDDVICAAGGDNVAQSSSHWVISRELLLLSDPNVIFLPRYSYTDEKDEEKRFREDNFFGKLSGRIVFVDANLMERQGPETASLVRMLAGILHPSLF